MSITSILRSASIAGFALATLGSTSVRAAGSASSHAAADATFKEKVAPLLNKYCLSCHGSKKPKADLNLAKYGDAASILEARKTWEGVLDYVEDREMPPEGKPRPTDAEYGVLIGWLQSQLSSADCAKTLDPGRVVLRRLNRVEYNNTIKDMTAVDVRPADDFPSDDVGYGFDNIGDVLSLPPILFEKYLAAAEKIAEAAIATDEPDRGKLASYLLGALPDSAGGSKYGDGRMLASVAEAKIAHEIKTAGPYFLTVKAFGQQAGTEPVLMEIRVDGKAVKSVRVPQTEEAPGRFEVLVPLTVGKHEIAAAFTNDLYLPNEPNPARRDRNLVVERIEVQGPADSELKNVPRSHRLILGTRAKDQSDRDYATAILERFAGRGFRRPATRDEVERLVKIYDLAAKNGERFERTIQIAIQAVLVSPHFLFKVEVDRRSKTDPKEPNPINDFELATRLSYFLWSTMPDADLIDLAKAGKLKDENVLEEQVRRMLKARNSKALVENFAGQWLQLRNLKTVTPDPKTYPDFDESLRASMLRETEMYFEAIKNEDRSILDLIDSDFTFVNPRLAKHYGIPFTPLRRAANNETFAKVTLTGDRRGGVLTQASVLTITSNPTRTSPVKRGKWILEQILNTPPPPPPPDVPELKEGKDVVLNGSLRQRMEQHRTNPNCASCHARMDPLGFGLENFDGIGAWRDKDGTFPIDASGKLPSGRSFDGPKGLKGILKEKHADFTRCLTEKMMTYALGRGLDYNDRCAVDRIAESVEKDGHKFSRLAVEIVKSDSFRKRRPKGADQ